MDDAGIGQPRHRRLATTSRRIARGFGCAFAPITALDQLEDALADAFAGRPADRARADRRVCLKPIRADSGRFGPIRADRSRFGPIGADWSACLCFRLSLGRALAGEAERGRNRHDCWLYGNWREHMSAMEDGTGRRLTRRAAIAKGAGGLTGGEHAWRLCWRRAAARAPRRRPHRRSAGSAPRRRPPRLHDRDGDAAHLPGLVRARTSSPTSRSCTPASRSRRRSAAPPAQRLRSPRSRRTRAPST